jgi:hypothetical protein
VDSVERDASDATTTVDAREASVFEDGGTDVASPTDAMAVTDATDATHATDGALDGASDGALDGASDVIDASALDGG